VSVVNAISDPTISFPSAPEDGVPGTYFRDVLGNYPTGVVFISAVGADGEPVGMVVGSFTSVSLEPPMVAFLADRKSTTFPKIREAGRFVVNVMASDQVSTCRALGSKSPDRFDRVAWSPSEGGIPVIEGGVARIDCELDEVVDAGDHLIALARVFDLKVVSDKLPLVFFRGEYGAFRRGHPTRVTDWFDDGWG
jgi:3-hydroxy-9,10-secoandrosta-1,3,5(10)-triene-9,17-dione monooxygenase reductase component